MRAVEIIQRCRKLGVDLYPDCGDVLAGPRERLNDELREAIRACKSELIETLAASRGGPGQDRVPGGPRRRSAALRRASADTGLSEADILEGLEEDDLQAAETEEITVAELTAFARARRDRLMREAGQIPRSYTSRTYCAGCGVVPIWPGVPDCVEGCPWCLVRDKGLSIPSAERGH